jgi:signal recognition particle GTPase
LARVAPIAIFSSAQRLAHAVFHFRVTPMFENLTDRLSGVMKTLRGQARLTESNVQDALREVRVALLEADVALPVVKEFIARVKERALGQEVVGSLTPGQAVVGVVFEELTALMGEGNVPLDLATTPPAVILMAGLQGSGKTTTTGKLAKLLREEAKKKVLLVSCDVYRPRRSTSCARWPRSSRSNSSLPRPSKSPLPSRRRRSTMRARTTAMS